MRTQRFMVFSAYKYLSLFSEVTMLFDLLIINESKSRRDFLSRMANDQDSLRAYVCKPDEYITAAIKALGKGVQFDIVVSDFFVRPQVGNELAETLETLYADIGFDKKVTAFTIPNLVYFLALNPKTRKPSDVFYRNTQKLILPPTFREQPRACAYLD